MKNKSLLIFVFSLLLTACGAESEIKKVVLANLKDPDSAKFGKFTLIDDRNACLTVNAKNSMGGYTGNYQEFAIKNDGEWVSIHLDVSHDTCIDIANQRIIKAAEEAPLKAKGCMACHAVNKKIIGPSYKDVANKYAGDKNITDALATKIIMGGSGTWGNIPMPPNNLTNDEAKQFAEWILKQ